MTKPWQADARPQARSGLGGKLRQAEPGAESAKEAELDAPSYTPAVLRRQTQRRLLDRKSASVRHALGYPRCPVEPVTAPITGLQNRRRPRERYRGRQLARVDPYRALEPDLAAYRKGATPPRQRQSHRWSRGASVRSKRFLRLAPSAVGLAACLADHGFRLPVDIDRLLELAAAHVTIGV